MSPLDAPKRSTVQILLVIAVGLLCLWQFHIPQYTSNFDIFPGDRGDARLVAYLMEHWYRVFQGLASWRSPGMFYPVEGAIGYADLVLGYGIVYSGLRTAGLGIFEAAEFTIILFNFLNYLVCFVLLNKVLRFNLFASIAGAAFFAFNSPKLVQLGHSQLQPIVFLPLAMIGIVLLVQKRQTLTQKQAFGLIALSSLSLALQLLTGFYPGWFFIFWSALFLIVTLLFTQTRNLVFDAVKRFWLAIVGGVAVFLVALIPFVLAYLPIFKSAGARSYKETLVLIPVSWSFLMMGHRNYLWGTLTSALHADQSISAETHIGIGLIPTLAWLGLVVFAVRFSLRSSAFLCASAVKESPPQRRRGTQRNAEKNYTNLLLLSQLVIATCLVYLLGLRYWNDWSPWQFVYAYVQGGQVVRAVARYALMLALPMAIAFAFLIDFLIDRISHRRHATVLFVLLFVFTAFGIEEQFARKEGSGGFSVSAENRYLNKLASSLPDNCSSFYVGLEPPTLHPQLEYQLDAMYVSLLKGVPTLNGYSGSLPPNFGLYEVEDPQYENNVKQWISDHRINGNVCRLFIDEPRGFKNLEDPKFFIRQQYLDILRREPDAPGLQSWLTQLNNSPRAANKNSGRVSLSFEFLDSPEFRERGYFVLRLYLAALGRPPLREEFVRDHDAIFSFSSAEQEAKKDKLVAEFVGRPEFKSIYDSLSDAAFVKKLTANRSDLVPALASKQKTRAQVLRAIVDDPQTISAFRNQGFVLMQFFAHLARDPEAWEYEDRLKTLNATGDYRQLIFDFLYSVEYRKRFGYVN